MKKWVRHIVFILMIIIIGLPLIQQNTGFVDVRPLYKAGIPPAYPEFSLKGWFEGSYQQASEQAIEQRVGFRSSLIRLKNQLEFSLFKKANARGVIVGKKRYLFEEDYLRAFTGGDYPGDWYWDEKFRRTAQVKDTLEKLGVQLAIVIEPSKASYYEEFIPKKYHQDTSVPRNNYQSLLDGCESGDIPILDLYSYFTEQRDYSEFPLFPKGGIHWSYYGMLKAMDTLLPMVEKWTGKDVPSISFEGGEPDKKLQGTDGDLARLMNLMLEPSHPEMAYPEIEYSNVADSAKPRVLAISDSFYFNIINAGIPDSSYANTAFWYYNVEIFPDSWASKKDTSMINFREEIESMDLVMVMITERFFYKFAWDFFDRLYGIYYPQSPKDYRYFYTSRIISHFIWFDQVVEDSETKGISLEEGLNGHAAYQFWVEDQKGKLTKNLSYYMMKIRNNQDKMQALREKAVKNGISIDEQIRLEAEWILNNSDK